MGIKSEMRVWSHKTRRTIAGVVGLLSLLSVVAGVYITIRLNRIAPSRDAWMEEKKRVTLENGFELSGLMSYNAFHFIVNYSVLGMNIVLLLMVDPLTGMWNNGKSKDTAHYQELAGGRYATVSGPLAMCWRIRRMHMIICFGLCITAFIYTNPWDTYLALQLVTYYPSWSTQSYLGPYYVVPLQGVWYYFIQTLIGSTFYVLWAEWYARHAHNRDMSTGVLEPYLPHPKAVFHRTWTAMAAAVAFLCGCYIMSITEFATPHPWRYAGLVLIWIGPPFIAQFAFAGEMFVREWRLLVSSMLVLGVNMALGEALALSFGVWQLSGDYVMKAMYVGPLPLEEIIFWFMSCGLITVTHLMLQRTFEYALYVFEGADQKVTIPMFLSILIFERFHWNSLPKKKGSSVSHI